MIKIRTIFLAVLTIIIVFSCKKDDGQVTPFDAKGQAVKDNDSLVKFLKKHYYDVDNDEVKVLVSGKKALIDDGKLKIQEVTENDINYKLYVYIKNKGTEKQPTVADSVLVNYRGLRIRGSKLGTKFDENNRSWFELTNVVRGWTYGFTNFKSGKNITKPNQKITYEGYGKGVLFIPSGLAYRHIGAGMIAPNQNMMFYVDLLDVNDETDEDGDGVPSMAEDINGDGKPWNDDTDKDGTPNYLDEDDDGDNVLTKYEDANENGNPRDDFSDKNKPNVPDYLNINIRKSIKK